jgi:hypothetical protein
MSRLGSDADARTAIEFLLAEKEKIQQQLAALQAKSSYRFKVC